MKTVYGPSRSGPPPMLTGDERELIKVQEELKNSWEEQSCEQTTINTRSNSQGTKNCRHCTGISLPSIAWKIYAHITMNTLIMWPCVRSQPDRSSVGFAPRKVFAWFALWDRLNEGAHKIWPSTRLRFHWPLQVNMQWGHIVHTDPTSYHTSSTK